MFHSVLFPFDVKPQLETPHAKAPSEERWNLLHFLLPRVGFCATNKKRVDYLTAQGSDHQYPQKKLFLPISRSRLQLQHITTSPFILFCRTCIFFGSFSKKLWGKNNDHNAHNNLKSISPIFGVKRIFAHRIPTAPNLQCVHFSSKSACSTKQTAKNGWIFR